MSTSAMDASARPRARSDGEAHSEPDPFRIETGVGRLRLQTLVRLRWLAVAGQSAAVLGVYFGFGFDLPLDRKSVV